MSLADFLRNLATRNQAPQAGASAAPADGGSPSTVTPEQQAAFIQELQRAQQAPNFLETPGVPSQRPSSGLPPWVLPVGVAVGVVLLAVLLAPRKEAA